MVVILFVYKVTAAKKDPLPTLKEVVILTIAAIPIGLPTVMSVTMAVGAKQMAEKKVIVKRLPAIEELASVTILCSGIYHL
jgi:H+-transporting ATPase